MKQKNLGKSCLHFSLQTSMTSTPASNANDSGSSSAVPCSDLSMVGDDFEKLSLGLHQQPALQNGACLPEGERHSQDAPLWFLKHITKLEENLRQTIHNEVQQCLSDVLRDHISGQTSNERSQETSQTLGDGHTDPNNSNSVRPKKIPDANEPLHLGITCDHCEQPIWGIRFKCGNCVDYDLCETCENIPGVHQTDHIFLKIRQPTCLATCRKKGERHKSLLKHLYPQFGQTGTQGPTSELFRCRKREKKVKRWLTHAENVFSSSGYGNAERSCYRSGLMYGNRSSHILSHIQSQSLHARHNSSAQNKQQNFSVRCLTDVSPGATLTVQPGQEFEKEWLVRNDSLVQFPATYRLRFSWGSLVPQGQVEVCVPPLKPGETGKVGPIHFRAPQQEGMYHSHWLLVSHPGGMPFPSPSLSCPVRVSRTKEGLHDEHKEVDTDSLHAVSNNSPEGVVDVFKQLNDAATSKFPSTDNKTTDPEETDDTASILSISSCESDEDYVKVQGPAQLVHSTVPLTQLHTASPSKGAHMESQETSSSSVDLLIDIPQNEDESEHRQTCMLRERAVSEVPSTVAGEASLPNSSSRSSIPSLNENHFAAGGHSDSTGTRSDLDQKQTSGSQASSQILRNDHSNQPEVVIPVLPEALVTGALTAAASVYNTAKAIISTLQPPTDTPPGPMLLLTEMGFHDRALNQRLLTEKGGCLEDVIAELIRLRADHGPNY